MELELGADPSGTVDTSHGHLDPDQGGAMDITKLLTHTQQSNASDLHLSADNPAMIRVNGDIRSLGGEPLSGDAIKSAVFSIMTEAQCATFENDGELDFSIDFDTNARFRVNAFTSSRGMAVAFRTIPTEIVSLAELGTPPIVKRLAELERGLVLVTGATGSGKSTTLAAMIDHINSTAKRHILTIEDPIEFVHRPKQSLINQRQVGRDTKSFARALKSALREDPDVILVGELRDHESISLALTAAETGHLVMGTLHSSSAPKTINRIIDVFSAGEKDMIRTMLASSLEAVIAQWLLKRADGNGRVAGFEILVGTPAVRNLIRDNKVPQMYSMMQMGAGYGMQTMADAVQALIDAGLVSTEEARSRLMLVGEGEDQNGARKVDEPAAKPAVASAPSTQPPPRSGGRREGYSF